jgi:hypothetical protein
MIQAFHRFLLDHLSSEGNTFPHNPRILTNPTLTADPAPTHLPVAAPVTQLLGVDAKNLITCMNCKAVREKENMTHVIDLAYPRPVSKRSPLEVILIRAHLPRVGPERPPPAGLHRDPAERAAAAHVAQGDVPDVQAFLEFLVPPLDRQSGSAALPRDQCVRV